VSAQLWALAVVGAIVLAAAGLETFRSRRARRRVFAASPTGPAGHLPMNGEEPYILYFTGDSCTVCRTHQEPALARQFHVYTLPTTVVMGADGNALHINYGYAPAPKLERQLADARGAGLRSAATA